MNFITTQKPLLIVAAVALTTVLSAASALAQDATPDYARAQTATSTSSRTAVQAEGTAFRARSEPSPWSSKFGLRSLSVANPQPRAAVKADTLRALNDPARNDAGEVFSMGSSRPAVLATASH